MEIQNRRLMPAFCVAALIVASATSMRSWSLQRQQPLDAVAAARVLQGTIDIHVHSAPDNVPRSIDGLDVARLARTRGMRGSCSRTTTSPTAGLAFLARKAAPGLEVFGGIDLNLTVGGMNPAAVEHMTQVTGGWGRFVWMSDVRCREPGALLEGEPAVRQRVAERASCCPETKAVIAVIAKHGLVLATGHVSAAEGLMLLREGRQQGVTHLVVTHAINAPILMDVPQMQEAARLGAFIEFAGSTMANAERRRASTRSQTPFARSGRSSASCPPTLARKATRCLPTASPTSWWRCAQRDSRSRTSTRCRKRTPPGCLDCSEMFTLDSVVPWGRSFDEYCAMFDLSDRDLDLKILDCGGGPASFNAEGNATVAGPLSRAIRFIDLMRHQSRRGSMRPTPKYSNRPVRIRKNSSGPRFDRSTSWEPCDWRRCGHFSTTTRQADWPGAT